MKQNYFKPAVIALLVLLNIVFISIYFKMETPNKNTNQAEISAMDAIQDAKEAESFKEAAKMASEEAEVYKNNAKADADEIESLKNKIKK